MADWQLQRLHGTAPAPMPAPRFALRPRSQVSITVIFMCVGGLRNTHGHARSLLHGITWLARTSLRNLLCLQSISSPSQTIAHTRKNITRAHTIIGAGPTEAFLLIEKYSAAACVQPTGGFHRRQRVGCGASTHCEGRYTAAHGRRHYGACTARSRASTRWTRDGRARYGNE